MRPLRRSFRLPWSRPAARGCASSNSTRGPARDGGLRKGDVILSIDGKRTLTFDDVRAALAASPGKSSVEFVDEATGRVESRAIAVVGGRIGITVVETSAPAGAGLGR